MANEPKPTADVEIECPHCNKWIRVKIFKEKISEPEYENRYCLMIKKRRG